MGPTRAPETARSESERELYRLNPHEMLSPVPDGEGVLVEEPHAVYGSAHTLTTLRSGSNSTSSLASTGEPDAVVRGNPEFIIDISPPSEAGRASRPRSDTFGGVPLPPAPSPVAPSRSPSAVPPRTRSSLTSSPAALRVGGGSFAQRRPMLHACLKASVLFVVSLVGLYVLLRTLLPPIAEKDREVIKIPRSFDDLKALNAVLQVYKDSNYWRVLGCFSVTYLFLQAFSIPGSMYLSILGGAMYGVLVALPLVCFCVSTGALLCYLISAALGPALLANSEKWRHRLDKWKERVNNQGDNLMSYLIVLRIAPLPPHWVVNLIAPHLGISMWKFWVSTFLGITGVTYIHTTIGTTLDQMTSSDDFHLISWKNFLGLAGIVVAVMVPVFMRRLWKTELSAAAAADTSVHSSDSRHSSTSTLEDLDDELAAQRGKHAPAYFVPPAPTGTRADESQEELDLGGNEDGGRSKGKARATAMGYEGSGSLAKASRVLGVSLESREGARA